MNNPSAYISYFRNLAAQHKPALSFYIMDVNEILEAMRSDITYPALILVNYNGLIGMSNADNPINNLSAGFIIIDHVADQDDFGAEAMALNTCWLTAQKILSRMNYEKSKCNELLSGFNLSSVKYEMMGPIFTNDFGFMFTWKVNVPFDTTFTASDWQDYSE